MIDNYKKEAINSTVFKSGKFQLMFGLVLFSLLSCTLSAQHLPPVLVYEPNDYLAGHQNWMLDQGGNAEIIAANNLGLLLYNGAQWRLYPSPEGRIIRSVKRIGDRIYAGLHRDFGYWEMAPNGVYHYTSLVKTRPELEIGDENFWNIIAHEEALLFQSMQHIYLYYPQTQQVKLISPPNGISKLFQLGELVIFHSTGKGLFQIEKGEAKMYYADPEIANASLVNMFLTREGAKILTKEKGFYLFRNGSFEKWEIPAAKALSQIDIFSAIALRNGDFCAGHHFQRIAPAQRKRSAKIPTQPNQWLEQ